MGGFEVSLKNFFEHSFAFQEKLGVFEVSLKNFLNIASPSRKIGRFSGVVKELF